MIRVAYYIAHSYAKYDEGGAVISMWNAARALALIPDIELTIFHPHSDHEPNEFSGIRMVQCSSPTDLCKYLSPEKFDVFHTIRFQSRPALAHCRRVGIATLYEVRDPTLYPNKFIHKLYPPYHRGWKSMLLLRSERRCVDLADFLLVPSKFALESIRNHFNVSPHRSGYSYNGLDTNNFYPGTGLATKSSFPVIVNAGRISPGKNFGMTIRIFQLLKQDFPDARLEIAGDGSDRQSLEDHCRKHNIRGVTFRGCISPEKLGALYRSAHLLLNTSQAESFGNVIAEAMACGLPVVCFAVGALPELVENYKTGRLCSFPDENQMYVASRDLIASPDDLMNLGMNAALSVRKRFSWDKRAQEVRTLYNKILSDRSFPSDRR